MQKNQYHQSNSSTYRRSKWTLSLILHWTLMPGYFGSSPELDQFTLPTEWSTLQFSCNLQERRQKEIGQDGSTQTIPSYMTNSLLVETWKQFNIKVRTNWLFFQEKFHKDPMGALNTATLIKSYTSKKCVRIYEIGKIQFIAARRTWYFEV